MPSLKVRIENLATAVRDKLNAITTALATKQATLVSGTNIKTINGASVLGSGNIAVAGGGGTAPVKGVATLVFNNSTQAFVEVIEASVDTNSVINTEVVILNDEILVENFETQVVRTDDAFTIYCKPKLGRHTGNVNINYVIL